MWVLNNRPGSLLSTRLAYMINTTDVRLRCNQEHKLSFEIHVTNIRNYSFSVPQHSQNVFIDKQRQFLDSHLYLATLLFHLSLSLHNAHPAPCIAPPAVSCLIRGWQCKPSVSSSAAICHYDWQVLRWANWVTGREASDTFCCNSIILISILINEIKLWSQLTKASLLSVFFISSAHDTLKQILFINSDSSAGQQ